MTGLVELLDRLDRAVASALSSVTTAEGVSRDGWRVLRTIARERLGRGRTHRPTPAADVMDVTHRDVRVDLRGDDELQHASSASRLDADSA